MAKRAFVLVAVVALSLVLLVPHGVAADDGHVVAAGFTSTLPASGVALTSWDGGSVGTIAAEHPNVKSVWVSVGGSLVGYVVGAPDFANGGFLGLYPGGEVTTGTVMIVVVVSEGPPLAGPTPAPTAEPTTEKNTYSSETWDAFDRMILQKRFRFNGDEAIGLVQRWPSGANLDVYVYEGGEADVATITAALDDFDALFGLNWSFVSSPELANFHIVAGFDLVNPPSSLPVWVNLDRLRGEGTFTSPIGGYGGGFTHGRVKPSDLPFGKPPDQTFMEYLSVYTGGVVLAPGTNEDGVPESRQTIDRILRHELVHALGWLAHWTEAYPERAGSDYTGGRPLMMGGIDLIPVERDVLRLLYDENVKPSMTREEVLGVINVAD